MKVRYCMDAIEKLNSVQFRDQILMRHLKHINPPVASLQFYFTKESSLTFRQRLSSGKQVFNLILQHISKIVYWFVHHTFSANCTLMPIKFLTKQIKSQLLRLWYHRDCISRPFHANYRWWIKITWCALTYYKASNSTTNLLFVYCVVMTWKRCPHYCF